MYKTASAFGVALPDGTVAMSADSSNAITVANLTLTDEGNAVQWAVNPQNAINCTLGATSQNYWTGIQGAIFATLRQVLTVTNPASTVTFCFDLPQPLTASADPIMGYVRIEDASSGALVYSTAIECGEDPTKGSVSWNNASITDECNVDVFLQYITL